MNESEVHSSIRSGDDQYPRILVFNKAFYQISETFIHRQVQALSREFTIDLMGFGLRNEQFFENAGASFTKIATRSGLLERAVKFFLKKIFNWRSNYTWKGIATLHRYFQNHHAIVHAHYGWNGVYLLPFLRKRNIPLVVSFHGNDASGWLNNPSYRTKLPELFDYATCIVLCSEHMIGKLELINYIDKVRVIPYGIDAALFKPKFDIGASSEIIKILHVGRLVPKKGVVDLIHVFHKLNSENTNVYLQIVGDGDERRQCEQLVSNWGLSNYIQFYGALPQKETMELMQACDIFVLNSRTAESGDMEGLPNVILEAMAFEKPVVSTNHAGIPMAIKHGHSGLLVDEYDNEGLLSALKRLTLDNDLRRRLGVNARSRVLEKFTTEIMTESLLNVFRGNR